MALVLCIGACSSLTTTSGVSIDSAAGIALLPIDNLSETPQADSQARVLLETQLRARGVRPLKSYGDSQPINLRSLLDSSQQLNVAEQKARADGLRYGFTGTISEWHYKAGADREPVVGMNLKLVDLLTGEILWQANAARTGWGYAGLPVVADKVIASLLQGVWLNPAPLRAGQGD